LTTKPRFIIFSAAFALAALLTLAAGAPLLHAAKAGASLVIYSDSLQDGWQPWGWAKITNYENTSPVHSGKKSIAIQITKGYDALYIHHAAFNTKGYRTFSFWANGGPKGGQILQIQATTKGKPVKAVVEGPLPAKKWTHIVVPLSALGASNRSIDGFWIQDHTGKPLPMFYVDDISLGH